jgi:hypothetical protein
MNHLFSAHPAASLEHFDGEDDDEDGDEDQHDLSKIE